MRQKSRSASNPEIVRLLPLSHPEAMTPRSVSATRPIHALASVFCAISASLLAAPNVQTFFIPFPEADFQTSLKAIDITGTPVGNSMKTIISLVVPTAGTVVRYDQWEDGYDADLNAPAQSTTLIWGDGNTSNGTAPGYPTDIFPAGATVNLTNNVALPRAAATLFYDGRDRIGCTAAIAVTRAGWGVAPGTVLASATEVYDTRRYGTSYKIPIGITTGSVQNFEYSSLHIISGSDNNTVQVDIDGNGTVDQTKVINLGESMLVSGGVKAGATVTSTKPVQVHELTGDVGSTYESRTFAIRPTSLWGSSYFAPVGTTLSTEVHTIFLYNPNASAITVTYETTTSTGTISVPANGNSQFAMPMNSGGHFFTVGGEAFYAVGANDSGAAATSNQTHDWGYALVPESYLTTGIVIGFGPGSDDLNAPTGPDQNGSPVWITPATNTTVYVNYSGDFNIGASTAPNGAKYDVSYNVNKLQSQTIYDPNDKDMTKARIFTTDGSKLAAAWGEDPSKAGPGAPYLDMGTTIVPFPQPALSKTSALVVDLNSDGKTGFGDTIEYTVRVANEGVVDLDNTIVLDALPNTCTYVSGSTKVNGITITDNAAPSTFFPVDESGYTLVSIPPGGFTLVKYRVTVNNGATSVINHASANGGQAVLTATTATPIVPAGGSAPTTITFSNSVGTPTTSYPQNGNVYVTVTNVDLNTDFAVAETITVTVTNPTTGDQELITLTETGPSTGVFRNTAALPSSITGGLTQQDNTLYALQGNGLVATFVNTQFGGTFTANAVIETSTLTKKLYLTDTLALDRVNPAAVPVDSTTASTAVLSASAPVAGTVRDTFASVAYNLNAGTANWTGSWTEVSDSGAAQDVGDGMWRVRSGTPVTGTYLSLGRSTTGTGDALAGKAVYRQANLTGATSAILSFDYRRSVTTANANHGVDVQASGDGGSTWLTLANYRWSASDAAWVTGVSFDITSRIASNTRIRFLGVGTGTPGGDNHLLFDNVQISYSATGGNPTASFTQTPTFATAFTMPAGAAPSANIYYTGSSGTMPASPSITAVMKKGAATVATSSSASASGGLLSFTFPALVSNANFAIGDAVTLEITTAQSGVTFTIDYDSSTKPSVVNLPTNTVIVINSFGLYDAAYPGGTLVTNVTNGQRVYARVTASDPFGAYDITGLDLAITDPANATSTVNLTSTVASTASSKTYEYSWLAGPNDGGYTIQATAKEGSEGITAVSSLPLQVTSLDLGTPSTTTFTDSSGNTVPSYTTSGPVYVQVVDRDQNTNTTVAETVTVVVTTNNGDRETITLTETGVNTGIFRSSAITTNTSSVTQNNSALNVVAGATLAANYVDPTDPADTSSASAYIAAPPATAVASVFKSVISPTNGKALVGGTVSFNITVTNPGSITLATVGLSDTFPAANLQFAGASITPNTTGSGTLGWTNVGPLTAGQSVSITVNFTALAAGATVTNSASVTGTASAGPSTASLAIEKPGVTVTKTLLNPSSGPVYIGDTVVWRIVVQNSGSTSLTTVPLSDNYSGGALTYVSATVAPNSVGAGSLLWNNIGPIAAAASTTIDVTMTVKGTSNPTTNTADVSYAVDASGNSVSPSVSSASVQTIGGSIGTTIFKDMNNNGVFDNGEGVQNVYVYSDTNGDGIRQAGEPFGITDYYGAYSIYNLPVAVGGTTYDIKVDTTTLPAGLTTVVVDPDVTKNGQTSITLTRAALDNTTANFGYRGTASVSDTVWLDVNTNGVLDATDRRISGVKVFIDQNNNGIADTNEPFAITDSDGHYLIPNLPDFTWTVAIDTTTLPASVTPTYDLNGIATPHKTSLVLTPGQARTDVDFGYVGSASIATTIYNDLNGDGTKAATDPGLAGVVVFLDLNADGIRQANEQFTTSDSSGNYQITGLTAGTYTVVVDTTTLPAGVTVTGDPDATKDGKTTVTLTAAQALTTANFGYQGNASIGDHVWNDLNGNGVQDTTEPAISGVKLFIDLNANGSRDSNEPFATTDAAGNYTISGLAAGSYTVAVDTTTLPAGVTQTGDPDVTVDHKTAVTLASGQSLTTADFGYQGTASVGNYVWNDANGDGVQDATEQPISGVTVFIDLDADGTRDANEPFATTNASGGYQITGLVPGNYTVAIDVATLPADVTHTGDPDVTKDGKTSVTLAAGVPNTTTDFGYQGTACISAVVFLDRDASGILDAGESAIPGVAVFLDFNGDGIRQGNEPQTTTDSAGAYGFTGLIPGTYTVVVDGTTLPTGVIQTADADVTLDNKTTVTLTAGTTNTTPNFGYQGNASVGDYVWIDADGDGVQDSTELPLSGVVVYMDLNANGIREITEPFATTNAAGDYTIIGLTPGTATVAVDGATLPGGVTNTGDPDPTKDGRTSVTLVSGQSLTTADFGYQGNGSIGTTVWLDQDGDGIKDAGEPVLAGVRVFIDRDGDGMRDANELFATTNASGNYLISGLPVGIYQVVVDSATLPSGVTNTGDPDATKDGQTSVTLAAAQNLTTANFGYQGNATVTGHLYIDTNGNGTQDSGEPDLADVDVVITDSLGFTQTVATNSSGNWTASVTPGSTTADIQHTDPQYPTGYAQTEGDDPTTFTAVSGTSTDGGTDGYFLSGSITGFVLADTNNDNTGDAPLEGVILTLVDSSGVPILNSGNPITATTAPNGSYSFGNLPPGTYGVVESQPSGYNSVSDKDGGIPDEIRPITVTAGDSNTANNFIEEQPGAISGTVSKDTDNDGDADAPLANVTLRLLDSLGQPVLDGSNQPITTLSAVNGTYTFNNVSPGDYRVVQDQPTNYNSVSDTDGANNNVIGNETPITVSSGNNNGGNNFIEIELGVISGYVLLDTDNNGSGDAPLPGVVVNLLDGSGSPVLDGYGAPIQVASGVGGYYSFTLVPVGTYRVSQNQPSGYGSVSDVDGANNNVVGDETPIVMTPGLVVVDQNFVEIQLGSISGYVYVDATPLAGVTLTLLDGSGNPIDGDPNTLGVQFVTTGTDSTGFYRFTGLMPGTYRVAQTQPFGYNSSDDADGGDLNIIGDITVITVLPGQENGDNDFIETPDTCPDTWAEWKFQHPGEQAGGNPDADAYDNLNEFAFAMSPDSGAGNAWTLQPSTDVPGTLEGVFVRPKGATQNVVYTLEYAALPGNPTVWQSVAITPGDISTWDNGDCTETVIVRGIETLTGLTGGNGVVRIKADLDEENDTVTDHTSHTEVEGWKETELGICCRTYSNPFLRDTAFTGTITGVSGQTLDLTGSGGGVDLGTLLFSGSYFIEVTSGENEGQRFDVVSATTDSVTLATDSHLFENAAPYNTLTGALPATLAGDTIVLRRHWTLGELFPAESFGGTDDPETADQVQLFTDGQWTIYWLYDDGIAPQYWVKTGDNSYADKAATVIAPGQGLFFNNCTGAASSVLAYGEVRNNDSIRPLAIGSNLVAGGYPLDQSAIGRAMNLGQGFFGSRDIVTADTFYVWKGDATAGSTGYDSYFLNHNPSRVPVVLKWAKIGDATLLARDSESLLMGNRSVFLRSKNGINGYTVPQPWTP